MTSSPGSYRVTARLKSTSLQPQPTTTWLSEGRKPRSRSVAAQIADLSAGVPLTAVYRVAPASSAALAASRTWSGVSKSGSPTPNA